MCRFFIGLAAIFTLFVSGVTHADQCAVLEEAQADKALEFLVEGAELVDLCEACGGTVPGEPYKAENIVVKPWDSNGLVTISVDGSMADLAYVFVKIEEGVYQNLSKLAGCESDSSMYLAGSPLSPTDKLGGDDNLPPIPNVDNPIWADPHNPVYPEPDKMPKVDCYSNDGATGPQDGKDLNLCRDSMMGSFFVSDENTDGRVRLEMRPDGRVRVEAESTNMKRGSECYFGGRAEFTGEHTISVNQDNGWSFQIEVGPRSLKITNSNNYDCGAGAYLDGEYTKDLEPLVEEQRLIFSINKAENLLRTARLPGPVAKKIQEGLASNYAELASFVYEGRVNGWTCSLQTYAEDLIKHSVRVIDLVGGSKARELARGKYNYIKNFAFRSYDVRKRVKMLKPRPIDQVAPGALQTTTMYGPAYGAMGNTFVIKFDRKNKVIVNKLVWDDSKGDFYRVEEEGIYVITGYKGKSSDNPIPQVKIQVGDEEPKEYELIKDEMGVSGLRPVGDDVNYHMIRSYPADCEA